MLNEDLLIQIKEQIEKDRKQDPELIRRGELFINALFSRYTIKEVDAWVKGLEAGQQIGKVKFCVLVNIVLRELITRKKAKKEIIDKLNI